ncbi:MAG: protoporphyrinogen oxidase [Clostridia bacterium]|nr:protoporphyrinogen oxidase [Clostridia bacterium]
MKKVIIIGGGMTGLAAAYTLEEKARGKVDYLLIEQENRLGGKIHTAKEDGFVLEGGPDCFLSEKPQVAQLSEKLGIEDRLLPSHEASKGSSVFTGGRLHKLPEGLMLMVPTKIMPFAFSSLISWPGKIRMAMDLFIPRRKGNQDESLGSFVTRRLGREALDKIAEPLIGGIHSGDPEQMSLKASFPRFLQMEEKYGSLIRAMLSARKNAPSRPQPTPGKVEKTYFMSFKGGMGELIETVVDRLDKSKLLLGQTVTGVKKREDGKYFVFIQGQDPLEADAIIVATPANVAADILREVDDIITGKLQEIPYVSSATVSLAYRRTDVKTDLNSFGFVIPRKENRKIMAVTYSSTKWHKHRTPNDEYVLVRAFVGGPGNQELVTIDDEKMLKMVQSEVKEIMGIDAKPVRTKIFRWVKGMPQYTMGHLERMEEVEKQLSKYPGLYIVGGSYRGVGISNCIGEGSGAAEKALAYLA